MILDKPTIVVIIMFSILLTTSIIIYIKRNEIFIVRTQTFDSFRLYILRYLPSNVVCIDTGTAECSVVDENEITNSDINNYLSEHEIRFPDIV